MNEPSNSLAKINEISIIKSMYKVIVATEPHIVATEYNLFTSSEILPL
jgi:predicted nucleic acid-binding protein